MSPDEIKQLRKDLKLSARELATSIKAEPEDVWAWETGERFPTKRFVTRMLALRKSGQQPATAAVKAGSAKLGAPGSAGAPGLAGKPGSAGASGLARLADPELWTIVRKLVQHPALFNSVVALAQAYPDPAAPPPTPSATDD